MRSWPPCRPQTPLYLPMVALQAGHRCFTSCRLSTQKGTQKQGHSIVKQRTAEIAQAITLGLVRVEVVTLAWQAGQVVFTGLGPKSGACT